MLTWKGRETYLTSEEFIQLPNVIGYARLHRRGNSQAGRVSFAISPFLPWRPQALLRSPLPGLNRASIRGEFFRTTVTGSAFALCVRLHGSCLRLRVMLHRGVLVHSRSSLRVRNRLRARSAPAWHTGRVRGQARTVQQE